MSVIAWDGTTIAADRQATNSDARFSAVKLRKSGLYVLGFTGCAYFGEELADWYEDGADKEKWPKFQDDKENWTRLIVCGIGGVFVYEQRPVAIKILDPFMAWGSGRDFALGAMAHGANAVEAVEIASRFNVYCGMGVDAFRIGGD